MSEISIYKSFLSGAPAYVGGKSIDEIETPAEKIFKLSSNENALGSSPKAIEAIKTQFDGLSIYPERTDAKLREALANHYDNVLSPNHFMATPSGSEMIDLLVRGFCGSGLNNIASNPCFQPYFMFTKNHGATTKDVPLIGPNFDVDVDGILGSIDDQTRLIFLTSPNNPTGTYIPKATMDAIIQGVPDHVIVVLDEVYHHFADADDYVTAMPYVKDGHQVIGLNSFSKAYGLAGLRMGYGYGPEKIMTYVRQLWKPFFLNSIANAAMAAALTDTEFIQKTTDHIIAERNYLFGEFDKMGLEYWRSQGNFIMVRPPMNEKLFEEKMLYHGIMIRPVSGFGAPGCVRITIGTKEANRVVVNAITSIIQELNS